MNQLTDSKTPLEQMIQQQIVERGITDERVIAAMRAIPRERFFPRDERSAAFRDQAAPIGHGQTISQPYIVALMTARLDVHPAHKVLEVGTGSGYLTALLASRSAEVTSVEINPTLAQFAVANLTKAGITNATVETGDAARGWTARAPYDVIVFTGSMEVLPDEVLAQLKPGGKVFVILGKPPLMRAQLITVTAHGGRSERTLFETVVAPLTNAALAPGFVF